MEKQDPDNINPLLWESLVQMCCELIPTIAVLSLTHRNQNKKRHQFKYYESLIESSSDEEFGNFNSNLNKGENDHETSGYMPADLAENPTKDMQHQFDQSF